MSWFKVLDRKTHREESMWDVQWSKTSLTRCCFGGEKKKKSGIKRGREEEEFELAKNLDRFDLVSSLFGEGRSIWSPV